MRKVIIPILLLFSIELTAGITTPTENFSVTTYRAGAQNWSVREMSNGWLYFANDYGLLEYDGNSWGLNGIGTPVRSLDIDEKTNAIYVGGNNEYGFFSPDETGVLHYTSLSDKLPVEIKKIGQVWNILHSGDYLYIKSDNCLLRQAANGETTEIKTNGYVFKMVKSGDAIFIITTEGLNILSGINTISVNGGDALKGKVIKDMCPFGDGRVLIATESDGIYVYDGASLKPFHTSIDNKVKDGSIFSITSNNSRIAFGFIDKGVAITDLAGDNAIWSNTENGLMNNTILGMSFDTSGNLWLCLDNGISVVKLSSAVRYIYGQTDFKGAGYTAKLYNGELYLGTNHGVFKSTGINKFDNFTPVGGCHGQIWSLDIIDGKLFCCADQGLFIKEGNVMTPVDRSMGFWQVRQRDNLIIASGYFGLVTLESAGGKWISTKISGNDAHPRAFEINSNSHIIYEEDKSIKAAEISEGKVICRIIKESDGCFWSVVMMSDSIIVSTDGCAAVVDDNDSLNSDTPLLRSLIGQKSYNSILKCSTGDIWVASGGELYMKKPGKSAQLILDNDGDPIYGFQSINESADGSVLVGSHKGFINPDVSIKHIRRVLRKPVVRRLYSFNSGDSILYSSSFIDNDTKELTIDYNNNSLRFIVDKGGCILDEGVTYAYMLEPVEHQFGEPTTNNIKEYTMLDEGSYTLHIKIASSDGTEEMESSCSFKITPPWYRSWWAYIIYSLPLIAMCVMAWILIYHRIERRNKAIVNRMRTTQTEMELKHKAQELANITLSQLNYNDALLTIKNDLKKVSSALSGGDTTTALRRIVTLQGKITANLENNVSWDKFQNDFDIVHADFIKSLQERYPDLTKKEKKLCIYIKMGLLTKEIAPLMNVSTRGVEMLRFRMRKRMGLTRDEDLALLFDKL